MCRSRSLARIVFLAIYLSSLVFAVGCAKNEDLQSLWGWGKGDDGEQAPDGEQAFNDEVADSACATDRSACVPIATGANLLTNSEFDADLEGTWDLRPTEGNGSLGKTAAPTVAPYDVQGGGLTSQSIQLQVGQREYVAGTVDEQGKYIPGPAEGAILAQEISVDWGGLLEVTVDVAVKMPVDQKWKRNKYAGSFDLMVDDQVFVSLDFGEIEGGASLRRTLTARVEVAAGPHMVALKILRRMSNDKSPTQYVDNFRAALAVDGPPEPPFKEAPVEQPTTDKEIAPTDGGAPTTDEEAPPTGEETPSDEETPPTSDEETPPSSEPPLWVTKGAPRESEVLS